VAIHRSANQLGGDPDAIAGPDHGTFHYVAPDDTPVAAVIRKNADLYALELEVP